ncbi:hypothetical protein BDM02DRAFT_3117401 [Thelephora ganbajun]|uniref:Uncharacterized protein n=1 Tax=Thelephora ganbajun TaxID=370292 RepID=A0ACB6ZCD0_THEGA|nr:hypothetical protein BDM02DRAFT_3117401 [Thelephora ganbajun]
MNVRPPATVDGHASIEAGVPPTKEGYSPSYSVPWHRQKKWRIFMLIGAIVVIGAVVGGAVGGTLGSKNNTSKGPSHGPSTVSLPTSTGTSIVNAPAQSSAANGAPLPGSSPISVSTAGPGAIPSTVGSGVHTLRIDGVTGSG